MSRLLAAGILLATTLVLLVSCSSGPTPPAVGTPPFYWAAARENFAAGDYIKAADQLDHLTHVDSEFTARSWPWRLVVLAGIAEGYIDLGEQYNTGATFSKGTALPYRKAAMDYRSMGARFSMQYAEAFEAFEAKNKDAQIPLAFPLPKGLSNLPQAIARVAGGILPQTTEMDGLITEMLHRGVLLSACRAVGGAKDPAKLADVLKGENPTVPREVFMRGMAQSLYEQSSVFSRQKLDQPERQKFFLTHAKEALKGMADTKDLTELKKKIDADLKKATERK